jgi:nucleotide-binding universal stress UspA family protein
MPYTQLARSSRDLARTTTVRQNILVATAGGPSSLGAVRIAAVMARRQHASVQVLAVTAPFPHALPTGLQIAPPSEIDQANQRAAIGSARRQLAEVRGTEDWGIRSTIGWPAEAIISIAQRWPASMIVTGLGKHAVLNRLLGSETVLSIARHSTVPVLAIPEDATPSLTHATAAIDFSRSSIDAAMLAAQVLPRGGTLALVHASPLIKLKSVPGSLPDLYTTGAGDKLAAIRKRIRAATGRRVVSALVSAEVVDGVLTYAREQGSELVAIGGHDQSALDRLLLGSVRTRVLRHARCAVLIAPHAGE